jgi:hypothetical protein
MGDLGLMIERSALGGYACPRWPGSLGLVAPSCPAEHVWMHAGHSGTSLQPPAKFSQEGQSLNCLSPWKNGLVVGFTGFASHHD